MLPFVFPPFDTTLSRRRACPFRSPRPALPSAPSCSRRPRTRPPSAPPSAPCRPSDNGRPRRPGFDCLLLRCGGCARVAAWAARTAPGLLTSAGPGPTGPAAGERTRPFYVGKRDVPRTRKSSKPPEKSSPAYHSALRGRWSCSKGRLPEKSAVILRACVLNTPQFV